MCETCVAKDTTNPGLSRETKAILSRIINLVDIGNVPYTPRKASSKQEEIIRKFKELSLP